MRAITGILIMVMCIGCTSLRVSVSTANPESLKKIHKGIDKFEKLAFEYKRALQPLLSTKIIVDKNQITRQFELNLAADITSGRLHRADSLSIDMAFKENYAAAVDAILTDFNSANGLMVNEKYQEAVDVYLLLPQKFQNIMSALDASEILKESQKELVVQEISTKLAVANIVFHNGRANLLGDKMVSYITMKQYDTIWKSNYNRTVSNTFFGNADIAVVLNEMPDNYNNNYAIKGVRVDAAKLIQSTFDVMTQVVNVAASIAGMPSGSAADANSFYPDELTDVKELPLKKSELESRKELLKESQRQLLLKILGEKIHGKTLAEKQASVADIKAFWDAFKTNLETNQH
ncbi:hypothetical protein [Flavobacterium sp.]|uniref:hypothetical protein n=1 Tax=Flavobacterium sp. TaxID=239 RepID=UPI00261154DF|nr:hypothetical protein [Flavobacterium sp.]